MDLVISFVKMPEQNRSEVNGPDPVIDGLQPDILLFDDLRDIDPMTVPSYSPVCADEPNFEVAGILDRRKRAGKGTWRGLVDRCRGFLAKGFMGTLVVELPAEGLELSLLSRFVSSWRSCRFRFESLVHSLVPTVLLRLSGLDKLWSDPETDPPDGEAGESSEGDRRERRTVVSEYRVGKPILLEGLSKDRASAVDSSRVPSLARDDEARASVGDGERIAIDTVFGPELAFEVGAPGIVGLLHLDDGFSRVSGLPAPRLRGNEAVAFEDESNSTRRGPFEVGALLGKLAQELLWSPGRMKAAKTEDGLNDVTGGLMRTGMRSARTIFEGICSLALIAVDPLVGRFPADAVLSGETGNRAPVSKIIGNELNPLVHE